MATKTEQSIKYRGPSEEIGEGAKVIVIKLPFDLQERVLSFPFIHAVKEKFPSSELHLITPKESIEVLNLLPFTAYYHEYEEDEVKTIFDVHRYTALAKIYNVDIFFSLTNSFADAALGLGLRAKNRIGFADNWKTLLLNYKLPRPLGHHLCEDYIALYKEFTKEDPGKVRVMARELTPIINDWEMLPYIAINLSPLRSATIDEEMIQLVSSFENQRIIFFASEEQDKAQIFMESFLAKLPPKNIYVNFLYKNLIDLAKMLAFAKGVITFNGAIANLSAYTGVKTLVLYDTEDPQRFGPYYYLADVMTLSVTDPTVSLKAISNEGAIKERKRFDMQEVYVKAFEFFKLVIT